MTGCAEEIAEQLLAFCRKNGRICPLPVQWNELWELLPNRRRDGTTWTPSSPLILAAWHHASNKEKSTRLAEHVEWAARHDELSKVAEFLRNLPEHHWHHESD
jgi:hypothetical protein